MGGGSGQIVEHHLVGRVQPRGQVYRYPSGWIRAYLFGVASKRCGPVSHVFEKHTNFAHRSEDVSVLIVYRILIDLRDVAVFVLEGALR